MHGKYKLPVPYYLPFEDQKTFGHYIVTIFGQFICGTSLSSAASLVVGLFLCIVLHILSYLDLINEIIGETGQQLNSNKKSEEELENCSKIIVVMVTQVVKNVSVLYTYLFLLMEFAAFGSLIIFGLTCLVLHQQYAIAISILHVAAEIYIICYVSEKVNDKFLNIAANIYNIPWYGLAPKERKIILRTMLCGNIGLKFKAAGIHYVTPARFLGIVKAAYSNCIILKNLILN